MIMKVDQAHHFFAIQAQDANHRVAQACIINCQGS